MKRLLQHGPAAIVLAVQLWTPVALPQSELSPREKIQELFESAQEAFQAEELDKAESDARQIVGISLDQLGAAYTALGRFEEAETAYEQACRIFSISPRPFLGLSAVYLRNGKYDQGIETIGKILKIRPLHGEARHILGKLYFMKGDFGKAATELADAYALNPDDTGVGYTLALAYLQLKRLEEAERILQTIVRRTGDSPQLRILIGRAYRETDYLEKAIEEFETAIELDPDRPRAHYYLGLTLLLTRGTDAFPEARKHFEAELNPQPDDYFANFYLGVLLGEQQENEAAIRHLRRAVTADPVNPDPHLYLGKALSRLGSYSEAITSLKKSIDLTQEPSRNNFQLANTYYILGQALIRSGNRDEGQGYIAKSQELRNRQSKVEAERIQSHIAGKSEPSGMATNLFSDMTRGNEKAVILQDLPLNELESQNFREAIHLYGRLAAGGYQTLARVFTQREAYLEAAQFLQAAVSWDSSLPELYFNLGLAHFRAQELAEAAAALRTAYSRNPERPETLQLLNSLAVNLVEQRQSELALEAIDFLSGLQPGVAELGLLRGQVLAQQGRDPDALAEFRRSLEIRPDLPGAHFNIGMLLIRQGQLSEASREFEQELNRNPDHTGALYHRAFTLISNKRIEEAEPLLLRVIQLQPGYADAYYQLAKIQLEKKLRIQAVANLETAARLDPAGSHIFYQLWQAYQQSGRTAEAERAFQRYRDLKKQEEEARLARQGVKDEG